MTKIVFFSIAAHGHTNPTIEVVRELVNKGHEVIYYSFEEFKEKIADTDIKSLGDISNNFCIKIYDNITLKITIP